MIEQRYDDITISDHYAFIKKFYDNEFIILLLYVDGILVVDHDYEKLENLKKELSKSLAMKELGFAKQIFGMRIFCDRENAKWWLSQESYIKKVLDRFNVGKTKLESSPFVGYLKLSFKYNPTNKKEIEEMQNMH